MRIYTVKKPFNLSDLDTHTSVEQSVFREQSESLTGNSNLAKFGSLLI